MKKLLVVLAVLFAAVGAYAGTGAPGDPASDEALVKVDVICPLTVTGGEDLTFKVIAGSTRVLTAADNNTIDFYVRGCAGQSTGSYVPGYEGATLTISYAAAPTSTTQDNKVTIYGQVKVDDGSWSTEESMSNVALATDVVNNVPFDGEIHIVGKVNSITAETDASLTTQYSWTFTVSAFYDNL